MCKGTAFYPISDNSEGRDIAGKTKNASGNASFTLEPVYSKTKLVCEKIEHRDTKTQRNNLERRQRARS